LSDDYAGDIKISTCLIKDKKDHLKVAFIICRTRYVYYFSLSYYV